MTDGTTLARVKALIADAMGVPANMIDDDMRLSEPKFATAKDEWLKYVGGGFDSLELIELGIAIQEHFGIDIPDADLDKPEMGTPAGIAEYIDWRRQSDADAALLLSGAQRIADQRIQAQFGGQRSGKTEAQRRTLFERMSDAQRVEAVSTGELRAWDRPSLREITDPAELERVSTGFVSATQDAKAFGIGVTLGGQHIPLGNYFVDPERAQRIAEQEQKEAQAQAAIPVIIDAVREHIRQLARLKMPDPKYIGVALPPKSVDYTHRHDEDGGLPTVPAHKIDFIRRTLRVEIDRDHEYGLLMWKRLNYMPPIAFAPGDALGSINSMPTGPHEFEGVSWYVVNHLPAPGWRVINPFAEAEK